MKSMVVLFALAAVASGSLVPLAQPPHHPALVLDPHGRPLDTAEVINARALHLQAKALEGHYAPLEHAAVVAPVAHSVIAPVAVAAPAAVSHQSRVDVISSPAVVSHAISTPVLAHSSYGLDGHGFAAHGLASHGLVAHGLAGHGHYLKKRSLGHLAYAAPVVSHAVVAAPAAVSHQSRVDVISSPAVVSHAVAAPVLSHAVAAPVVAVAPSAVSHQSRVDVRTSPAVVATAAVAPVAYGYAAHGYGAHGYAGPYAHGVVASSLAHDGLFDYGHAGVALSHGHLLKKRSLATFFAPVVHTVPSAVSHQSRVDVISKPAVTEVVAAPVLYAAPIAHSAIWSAPFALKAAHW